MCAAMVTARRETGQFLLEHVTNAQMCGCTDSQKGLNILDKQRVSLIHNDTL